MHKKLAHEEKNKVRVNTTLGGVCGQEEDLPKYLYNSWKW